MVGIMDSNLDSSSIYQFVAVDVEENSSKSANCFDQLDEEMHGETMMVRTVAMSANIASTVKDEVKHLIRINTFESNLLQDANKDEEKSVPVLSSVGKTVNHPISVHGTHFSCSHILPTVKENIVSAVVLSKWDDIMGPQTVHVWLPGYTCAEGNRNIDISENVNFVYLNKRSIGSNSGGQMVCSHGFPEQNVYLMKAIKYVTSHTVNYTGVSLASSNVSFEERNSNLFVVPDLELVAQSLVFYVRSANVTAPFSLAVLVGHKHYDYFLHLRRLFHQWLRRMAARLHGLLHKYMSSSCGFERSSIEKLNNWVMELCHTVFSLGLCGLGTAPLTCNAGILSHPLLERALTSHLQTFGCTVVMGTSSTDINTCGYW